MNDSFHAYILYVVRRLTMWFWDICMNVSHKLVDRRDGRAFLNLKNVFVRTMAGRVGLRKLLPKLLFKTRKIGWGR